MKLICKKAFVFLLAMLILSTTCFSGVMAQEVSLESVAAKIEALPDYEDFSASTDEGFDKAIEDALKVIEEMANLTDDDFYSLDNSSKVSDLYVGLTIMKLEEGVPTTIPANKDELLQQLRWMYAVGSDEPEFLISALSYTSVLESEDPDVYETFGDGLYEAYSQKGAEVLVRVIAFLTTMSEEEQEAITNQVLSWALEEFPETFTVENFWDYASDFYYSFYDSEITATDVTALDSLMDSFEYLVMDERFALTEELDKRIAAVCDVEAAESASELGRIYYHEPICDELWNNIDLISMLYEEDASAFLTNYELFEEYQTAVYSDSYDAAIFGDLNGDWFVDAKDALIVLKMSVGKTEITDDALWYGDVDGNGDLDAKDALYILKYSVNKIDMFPVEEDIILA